MRDRPPVRRSAAGRERRAFSLGLGLATLLHALPLAGIAWLVSDLPVVAASSARASSEATLTFSWDAAAVSPPVNASRESPARTNEFGPTARSAAASPARAARTAAVTPEISADPALASADGDAVTAMTPEAGAPQAGAPETPDSVDGLAPETSAAPPGPRLSLDALGVGPGSNPFLAPARGRPGRNALGQRIDNVLRSGLAEHDQVVGLGPEGPAVAAVTDLVMQSTAAPNTTAVLVLRTDEAGETVHVEVAEASSDTAAWTAIASDLLRALRGKKLRVPPGSGGVTFQMRVTSREALPSGADPGLAVDLFGQEIKAGAGKRSTRLRLLTPKIALTKPKYPHPEMESRLPGLEIGFDIVSLLGDPVDIAAVARRVVHAHLVSLETHPRESP